MTEQLRQGRQGEWLWLPTRSASNCAMHGHTNSYVQKQMPWLGSGGPCSEVWLGETVEEEASHWVLALQRRNGWPPKSSCLRKCEIRWQTGVLKPLKTLTSNQFISMFEKLIYCSRMTTFKYDDVFSSQTCKIIELIYTRISPRRVRK